MTTTVEPTVDCPSLHDLPGSAISDNIEERVHISTGNSDGPDNFAQRVKAHEMIETMHALHYGRRKLANFQPSLELRVVLWPGREDRDRAVAYHLSQLYAAGVPVLHNGGLLFGRECCMMDVVDLTAMPRGPEGGAVLHLSEVHTINMVVGDMAEQSDDFWRWPSRLRGMGYQVGIGSSLPNLIGSRVLDQVDEVWRSTSIGQLLKEPAQVVDFHSDSARLNRWLWRSGTGGDKGLSLLRAIIASDEMGIVHEPKPYLSQCLDWGWMQVAELLMQRPPMLKIGVPPKQRDAWNEVVA